MDVRGDFFGGSTALLMAVIWAARSRERWGTLGALRWAGCWFAVGWGLVVGGEMRAQISGVLRLPAGAESAKVEAGKKVGLELLIFNLGSGEESVLLESNPAVWVYVGEKRERAELSSEEDGGGLGSERVRVAAGMVHRRRYGLATLATWRGSVMVEWPGSGSRVHLEVREPANDGGGDGLAEAKKRERGAVRGERTDGAASEAVGEGAAGLTSLGFFKRHFFPHDPVYFIAGLDAPNAKFQLSFRYRLLNGEGELAQRAAALTNLYFAYTQVSLWDWSRPSAPFLDSSYKPAVHYEWRDVRWSGAPWDDRLRFDLSGGIQHESNGRDGLSSRSLNVFYVRPRMVVGGEGEWTWSLEPRVVVYLPDLDDNPDLTRYRGHVELYSAFGKRDGWQVAATGRIGDGLERGSLMLDWSYPLRFLPYRTFAGYFHVQFFTGYGESLLYYNERSSTVRAGFSIWR